MNELDALLKKIELSIGEDKRNVYSINGFSVFRLNFDEDFLAQDQLQKTGHRSDFYSFALIRKGEITVRVNLKETVYFKNDLLIFSPEVIKSFVSVEKGTVVEIIAFTAKFLSQINLPENFIDLFNFMTSKYTAKWILKSEDVLLFSSFVDQLKFRLQPKENQSFSRELLYHTFMIFIYEMALLSKTYVKTEKQNFSRKEVKIIEFHKLVKQHFREERSVKFYADVLCLSPKYLSETVKEITKLTAGEIIDNTVILEAKILLDNPQLSILQVAEVLNFSDQSFFGKYFKRHVGLSPKKYRQAKS